MKALERFPYILTATLMLTLAGYASTFGLPSTTRHDNAADRGALAAIFKVPSSATDEVDIATLNITGRDR